MGEATFETEAPDAREMRRRMAKSDGLYPWLVACGRARSMHFESFR